MKKDIIFFAEEGLTATSANHVANMAKEYVENTKTELESISFFSETMQLVGTGEKIEIAKGSTKEELEKYGQKLQEIAEANSLIAWLREAIKAKNSMLETVENLNIDDYCSLTGTEKPIEPSGFPCLTEDDYIGALNIKERNRYYQLEAIAAVIGKHIHPKGQLSEARKQLYEVIKQPTEVKGEGRDAMIYHYSPSVKVEDVENIFFELQKKHREIQAQLNAIKANCEKAVKESQIKASGECNKAYEDYKMRMNELQNKLADYQLTMTKEIGNYKIVIPDSLKNIYNKIQSLGK